MTINLSMPATHQLKPRITVVGVGGAGGNAVNNMITSHLEGVEFVVANTDAQALAQSLSERRIQLGVGITQGLGAGSQPDVGRAAAEEAIDEILENLEGSNMVFITAGMGGGTGTGGGPVVARAAREQGILTVGVVTKPFQFEGVHRMRIRRGRAGRAATIRRYPDHHSQPEPVRVANEKTTFADAFKMADDVLYSGVRGVTDLMVMPGLINLDFADVRAVMAEMGKAMMGTGEAEGENRAVAAAEAAISNPLLDDISMEGARGVLINITGGYDMTLFEVDAAANRIRDEVDTEANIIFGSTFDESLDGCMRVSVVSTGIEATSEARPRPVIAVVETPDEPAVEEPALDEVPGEAAGEAIGELAEEASEEAAVAVDAEPEPEPEPRGRARGRMVRRGAGHAAGRRAGARSGRGDRQHRARTRARPRDGRRHRPAGQGFIPPPPVMPGPKASLSDNAEPFAAAAMSNGGKAAAPKSGRRGLSLFERMTGTGRARPDQAGAQAPARIRAGASSSAANRAGARDGNGGGAGGGGAGDGQTGRGRAFAQGREDVLDIPAFLRRQSN